MIKTKILLLVLIISSVLAALSAVMRGFPLRFLEPVYCIQIVGAVCPPFAVNWFPLFIDFVFWAAVTTIGFVGVTKVLTRVESKRVDNQTQPLLEQSIPFKSKPPTASRNKLLIIGIVVMLLLVLATGIAGYLVYQNNQPEKEIPETQPTPTPYATPTPDLTAEWKKYRDEELGFEVEYPPYLSSRKNQTGDFVDFVRDIQNTSYALRIQKNFLGVAKVEDIYKEEKVMTNGMIKNVTLWMGCDMDKEIECRHRLDVGNYDNAFLRATLEKDGNKWYIFGWSWKKGEKDNDEEFKKFDQILSTFKFLDQNQTSDQALEAAFRLKYPEYEISNLSFYQDDLAVMTWGYKGPVAGGGKEAHIQVAKRVDEGWIIPEQNIQSSYCDWLEEIPDDFILKNTGNNREYWYFLDGDCRSRNS